MDRQAKRNIYKGIHAKKQLLEGILAISHIKKSNFIIYFNLF